MFHCSGIKTFHKCVYNIAVLDNVASEQNTVRTFVVMVEAVDHTITQ